MLPTDVVAGSQRTEGYRPRNVRRSPGMQLPAGGSGQRNRNAKPRPARRHRRVGLGRNARARHRSHDRCGKTVSAAQLRMSYRAPVKR